MSDEIKMHIKEKLSLVPNKPGSYQMKNKDGVIIYVGKAKNLKNRLKSYFTGRVSGKTEMLVNDIVDFDYIVTSSELESLILEITLIKKYDPKYNILLKDDKSYPYIELTNEKYPRLKIVRNIKRKKNKSHIFGPYPNVTAARKTVNMLNRIYPLRKCENMKKELCLYYHLGECLGYCERGVDTTKLQEMTSEIISFLKGNSEVVTSKLKQEMLEASNALNFEKAKELKEMLDDIEVTLRRQKIDLNKNYNFDLFNYYQEDNYLSISVFFIREGLLFGKHSEIITSLDDVREDMLEYIIKFYERNVLPKEIVVASEIDMDLLSSYLGIKVNTYQKGSIKKLIDLARENAIVNLHEKQETLNRDEKIRLDSLKELQELLGLEKLSRIESFDNSHLFGTFYVGAMVTFVDFLPNKNEYRKFKITSDAKDDISAMKEVLYRRYFRVLMENLEKPDLIVMDGGEQQVLAAREILDSLHLSIPVIGLKKDEKHRTNILLNQDLEELCVSKDSNVFLFLSKIQEEVHRFAISYHRDIKSKGSLSSILDLVDGIGPVRKKTLLKKYGSLKKIKEASVEDLKEVLSSSVATNLLKFLKEKEEKQKEE